MSKTSQRPRSNNFNRLELIRILKSVLPGTSRREIQEQTACFVFKDGRVHTFNDELACSAVLDLKIKGAVRADALLAILRDLSEEEIKIEESESGTEVILLGKNRQAGLVLEKEILLPIGKVETPTTWTALHPEFRAAVRFIHSSAGNDYSLFTLTCIHVTPDFVEACDNYEVARCSFKTGFSKCHLIRKDSLKHISSQGMIECSETNMWVHFRNSDGLVYSCRRDEDEKYHDLNRLLKVSGDYWQFPEGLTQAVRRAKRFSDHNAENTEILIELRPGKMRVRGVGLHGWSQEFFKTNYKGRNKQFMISPSRLIELLKQFDGCVISKERLKAENGCRCFVMATESAS